MAALSPQPRYGSWTKTGVADLAPARRGSRNIGMSRGSRSIG